MYIGECVVNTMWIIARCPPYIIIAKQRWIVAMCPSYNAIYNIERWIVSDVSII